MVPLFFLLAADRQAKNEFNRHLITVCSHIQFVLGVLWVRFVVTASACLLVLDTPLVFNVDFSVLRLVKVTGGIQDGKVREEVTERNPEHSIVGANVDLVNILLAHAFVDDLLPFLVPFLRLIAPGSLPLSSSPWVPQLEQFVPVNNRNIHD